MTNCDCVDRSFWYNVHQIDNDGMITAIIAMGKLAQFPDNIFQYINNGYNE